MSKKTASKTEDKFHSYYKGYSIRITDNEFTAKKNGKILTGKTLLNIHLQINAELYR